MCGVRMTFEVPQRAVGGQRLPLEDVDARAGQLAGAQRGHQRGLSITAPRDTL